MNPENNNLIQNDIYAFIKGGITSLRFAPGKRLRAAELAELTHSSRTPVREALGRLEQEGLVRRDSGWGYVVSELSVKDILDLFGVREALEVQAASEVMPYLTPAAIEELAGLNAQAEAHFAERGYDAFIDRNRRFHLAIARLTGNKLLQQMLSMIHDRVCLVGGMILSVYEPRAEEWLLENRQIMASIRARNPEELVLAVRAHVRRGREHFLRLLHQLDVRAIEVPPQIGHG